VSFHRALQMCAVAAGLSCVGCVDEDYAAFRAIQPGMTQEEVESTLGEPTRSYTRENAPEHYYVEGYSHENRTIRHKVFIYMRAELIAYVYFDQSNRVEHTFVGGT